jgi:hypothetical protein
LLKASCHEQAKFIYGKQKKINNGAWGLIIWSELSNIPKTDVLAEVDLTFCSFGN